VEPALPDPSDADGDAPAKPVLEHYKRPTMPWERAADPAFGRATNWASLGIELAAAVLLFGALGWWLDGLWGTTPWLLVVLAMLGLTAALVRLVRRAIALGEEAPEAGGTDEVPGTAGRRRDG
jgi:F0F1-type ATP synthase assembly protein I